MRFSIGDKVKVIDSYLAGMTGVVVADFTTDDFDYYVKSPDGVWGFHEDELEALND